MYFSVRHIRVLAAPVLLCLGGVAAAQSSGAVTPSVAPTTNWPFRGAVYVETASPACASFGVKVGLDASAIYRPKLAGDTAPGSLTLHDLESALAIIDLSTQGQLRGTGGVTSRWLTPQGTLVAPPNGSYVNMAVSPPTIDASTMFVTLRGTFNNFAGLNCTVTIRGAFTRRVG